ncbi:MAG: response regulator [Panacagrimonas sp.]
MSDNAGGWFDSLPVRGKLSATLALQVAVLTLGCLSFLYAQNELSKARAWTTHTYVVLDEIDNLRAEAIEQQTGIRGYIITEQDEFLQPYRSSIQDFDTSVVRLRALVRDNPVQAARVDRLHEMMIDWRVQVAQKAIEWMANPETRILAIEQTRRGEGKRRIDAIKRLCLEFSADETLLLEQRAAEQRRLEWILIGLTGVLLVIGWLAAARAVRTLNRLLGTPMSELAQLVPLLNTGAQVVVPYRDRKDEVGVLSEAFEKLRESSVRQMERDWVSDQSVRLNAALQHAETSEVFADILLRRVAEALGVGYALAYCWNDQRALLEWCAAFGLPDESVARQKFRLGEGLIGQCVVERKAIQLHPVPAGHRAVVTGLGQSLPERVLILPMTARGETVAALELGVLGALEQKHHEFLDQVLVTAGLGWQALLRSRRTQELLDESQAQAEELRASDEALRTQQEELRAVNEALRSRGEQLEEQGQRLRASEEELRAQAEELRVTNAALEEKSGSLRQRQAELETAREDLEQKAEDLEQASRYKSEFLANMSHELRTPLNSMLILSKLLADNPDGNLDAEQVESARIMHDSGKSLLKLINDILDLSKVEAGKMALTVEDVEIKSALSALHARFRPLANERGLRFELKLADDLPEHLHTDGARLGQILSNLLSNAFKFTHEGVVELSAECVDKGIAFHVKDSGIGIPADKLERVFQAFEQADSGTSRRYGGTGLGLSIVRGMAGLLGGQVRVESREGEGSRFSLLLPLQSGVALKPMSETRAPTANPAIQPKSPATMAVVPAAMPQDTAHVPTGVPALLVVEDDAAFARVLADIATRRGLEVLVAGSGAEALRLASERRLFGVLLDIGLPDMTGWEVLERLKANPHTSAVPVHVISGREDEAHRGQELGAIGFLQKPVTREAVMEALERVGGTAQARQRRLLLVDADPGSRQAVTQLLAVEQAEIVEVPTAAEALSKLRAEQFDGLILDPELEDEPGLEFLARASKICSLPPVVIYSRRELTAEENLRLREYTGSIVIHGSRSSERLLDEVALFLHALRRPGRKPDAPVAHAPIADIAGKTVLVVDDDMRNVFALSKALRGHGLNVVMAQDGHKALAQLETRNDIDLVLMDIMMPGMDGYETIRRVRSQRQWQTLPIIAVTAKAMKGDREKCLEAGANDYCSKPIDMDQLISMLQVWI